MILFEDEDEAAARAGALEQKILEMIEEAALALGIEPTGWAWKCSECGKNVRPDSNFGHDGGPGFHCGPVGIAPEHAEDAWRAVLAAIRGRQRAAGVAGYVVTSPGGLISSSIYTEGGAVTKCASFMDDPTIGAYVVPVYFAPPDRPAEAVKPDPRAEQWAAIPKVRKP